MSRILNKSHMWTKEEVKRVNSLWDNLTTVELAKELDVTREQLGYIVLQMRKAGFKLPRKHENGRLQSLLREVLAESN